MKFNALKFLISSVSILIIFVVIFPTTTFASQVVFSDNFDNIASSSALWINSGPQLQNGDGSLANWSFLNGEYGMKIANKGFQFNETVPKNWNSSIKDYVFEGDIKILSGVDTNIVFRYQDHNHWYGIHGINDSGTFVLQKYGSAWFSDPPGRQYTFNQGVFYHFKIQVIKDNIKIYINNQLLWDVTDTGTQLSQGSPGLQASTGAVTSSEVHFDNVVVTSIDPSSVNVPLLKQTSDPWQSNEYDSASTWSKPEPSTINRWGCAITSATMILNYYGYAKLPNGSTLDPGSLNTYLTNQPDGYLGNGMTNWIAIANLTKAAKSINNITTFDALQYQNINTDSADLKTQLTTDLTNSHPDILEVPGHFIVAKGINNDTFNINDPYYDNRLTLQDGYNNTFTRLGRFYPTSTNLSYLLITADPQTDLLITDPNGKRTGSTFTTDYTEIPNSSYFTQNGITSPVSGSSSPAIKILMIPTPTDGDYKISAAVKSTGAVGIPFKLYEYTADGTTTITPFTNFAKGDEPASISFSYQQNPTSSEPAPVDTTPPQMVSAKTLDKDKNGKMDTIQITFARDINRSTVNPTGTDFTIDGYNVTSATEISPGIVEIVLVEKLNNDTGQTPLVTLLGNGTTIGIKDIISKQYNHKQLIIPADGASPTKPIVDILGGDYLTSQSATLTSFDNPINPTIYYTLDGTNPATSSSKLSFSTPITINDDLTLQAIASDSAGNVSDVLTQTYGIAPTIFGDTILATASSNLFTVNWKTNRLSKTRVVFGSNSKKIPGSDTLYGYSNSTTEGVNKVTNHIATISGLLSGTTYYYRVISRGSPEQLSDEQVITTTGAAPVAQTTTLQQVFPNSILSSAISGNSGSSSSSTNSSNSSSQATCNDQKPQSAPTLISASAGINTVTLNWQEGNGPISYYLVGYGTKSGELLYGNPNIGGKGTTSYTVQNLSGQQSYYFKVRAGNGCTPGDYSNELSAIPLGFIQQELASGFSQGVLGTSTNSNNQQTQNDLHSNDSSVLGVSTKNPDAKAETKTISQKINRKYLAILIGVLIIGIFFGIYMKRKKPTAANTDWWTREDSNL